MSTYRAVVFFVSFLFCVQFTVQQNDEGPLVESTLGKIQGSVLTSQKGATIYAFRGIPYAQPPLNELRFKAPVPIEPWEDTLNATSDALSCPQTGPQLLMDEDCLKLNVFSRNLTGKAPVIVYIHGGGNIYGSGHSEHEAGPNYFLDHDVVFVAFNYRLGALGFLSTGTADAPGNQGYLDQVLVLQWVRDHISNFGGDPEKVTIMGMSAGGMAVTLHMASPLSKGLFHGAISMSGSATNTYNVDNMFWAQKLAREVGCPLYNPADMIACFRTVSWKTMASKCTDWEAYGFVNMKWNYEIDGHFLHSHPTEVFASGLFNAVPLMAGITKDELDFVTYLHENNTGLLNDINDNFDLWAPELFMYNATADTGAPRISQRIRNFYLPNGIQITGNTMNQLGEVFSDSLGFGVHRLVQLASSHTPVFFYRMDYVGQRSAYMDHEGKPRGVGHSDDLQYLMPSLLHGPQIALDDPDTFMVERLTKWWTNFARDGYPDTTENWKPSRNGEIITLYNDKEFHLGERPFQERYALWESMFPMTRNAAGSRQIATGLSVLTFLLIFIKLL